MGESRLSGAFTRIGGGNRFGESIDYYFCAIPLEAISLIRLIFILLASFLPTLVPASPLPCKDEIAKRICATTTTEYCDPVTAGFFASKIVHALEDAHPTIQRLACEVKLYDISNEHGGAQMISTKATMRIIPEFFLEQAKFEIIQTSILASGFNNDDVRFHHEGYTQRSELKFILYHELAHFLEHRAVKFNAFDCTDTRILTSTLANIALCKRERFCSDQPIRSSVGDALSDLRNSNHISFYGLSNPGEDFAELLATSQLLKKEPGRSYISENGVVLYDINEALASDDFAQKLRIVDTLLNFPLDDENEKDKLNYELATCSGRFAEPPLN